MATSRRDHPLDTDGLRPEQETALVALLNETTILKAAQSVGVGERTLHRWLDEPAFARAYRKARRQAFRIAIDLSQKYSAVAVQTLVKIAADGNAPHSARVSAASAILKFGREAIELDDLEGRIEALEAGSAPPTHRPFGPAPQPPATDTAPGSGAVGEAA